MYSNNDFYFCVNSSKSFGTLEEETLGSNGERKRCHITYDINKRVRAPAYWKRLYAPCCLKYVQILWSSNIKNDDWIKGETNALVWNINVNMNTSWRNTHVNIKHNIMIIIWYQTQHCHYLVAFFGRPKVVLVAVGAPGFTTAGLQLFQWAVINLGAPDA